jgi:hypothetical protein
VRVGGTILIVTILLGLLAAVALFAWAGLAEPGEPMPSEGYVALALGALAAVLVGIGLMGLVFYSNRRGYDEPPHFHEDHWYGAMNNPSKKWYCVLSSTRGAPLESTSNRVRMTQQEL